MRVKKLIKLLNSLKKKGIELLDGAEAWVL